MNAFRLAGAIVFLAAVAGIGSVLGSGAAGCGNGGTDLWECYGPDGGSLGLYPTSDPSQRPGDCPCALSGPPGHPYPQGDCAWLDAGTEGGPISGCNGTCVEGAPDLWDGPVLLWTGEESLAPGCPLSAPLVGFEGWAGLTSSPLSCGTCTCSPSTGSCALPVTITASAAPCALDGGSPVPFDGPPSWDGGCTAYEATAGAIESVTAGPLGVVGETPCTSVETPPIMTMDPPGTWSMFARSCKTPAVLGTCSDLSDTCVPAAPDGFRQCIARDGDVACPSGPYSEQNVLYTGAEDTRSCSPCTCSSEPGSCSALLSVYAGSACDGATLLGAATLSSSMPICFGFAGGSLGSKSIGAATYAPSACTPSGGPTGTIVGTQPVTYCCVPSP